MAIRNIVKFPDAILRKKANEVTKFDEHLHKLLEDMNDTLYDSFIGVGLAAPQVGSSKRVVVIDCGEGLIEFVNPVITQHQGNQSTFSESCLSIPGFQGKVNRYNWVKIRAQDRDGKPFEWEATGLAAVCVQHEIDHLDGILFIDRAMKLYTSDENAFE